MKNQIAPFLFLLFILTLSCQKEVVDDQDYPRLKTHKVTNVSANAALLRGEVIALGKNPILEQGFICHTYEWPHYDSRIPLEPHNKVTNFEKNVEMQFVTGQTYHVWAFVKTADYLVYGNEVTFVAR